MPDGDGSIPVYCGTADVQDAFFHRNGVPMWLSRYFGMLQVRAGDVGEEFADGQALNPDDMLVLLPRCLPMGVFLLPVFRASG